MVKIEDKLWSTQYGFRQKRSTNCALHITRRLQDFAEASGDSLILLFLDWEKAFDKISQPELIKAIGRLHFKFAAQNHRCVAEFVQKPRIQDNRGRRQIEL